MFALAGDRRLLFALLLGGALVGLVQTTYGPAFPAFAERYRVGAGLLGLLVGAHFLGNLVGTALAPGALSRLGFSRLLPLGPFLMGVGAVSLALAPSFLLALVFALLIGLGFGLANTAQLVLTGVAFGERRFWAFNLESAAFGLGSMLGPWVVGGLGGVFLPYLVVGLFAFAVAGVFVTLPRLPAPPAEGEKAAVGGALWLFLGLFFLYVGLEASAGHWGAYHLAAVGSLAALWIGLYWGVQTLARFLLSPFTLRLAPSVGFVGAVFLSGLVFLAVSSLPDPGPGYAAAGFALAPAFPAAMAWAQGALGPGGRVTSWLLIAAALGGAVFPSLFGPLVDLFGPGAVPLGLAALALAAGAVGLWLKMRT